MAHRWKLGLALLLGLVAVIPAEGAGPARNGLIVYSGVVTENAAPEIYAFPLSGGLRINVSRDPGADRNPAVSPDGTRIIFESSRRGWVVALADGSAPRRLAAGGTQWAPDSRHVTGAVSADDQLFVVVVDTETAAIRRVGLGEQPEWSPGGASVAYIGSDGLYVSDLKGAPVRVATARIEELAWSPDGTRIAYRPKFGGLAVVDVATRTTTELAPSAGFGIRWSPDGARVYFTGGSVPAAGGDVRLFGPVSELELAPSGTRLALVRDDRVLLATLDGAVIRDFGRGRNVSWSPSGAQLAFVHGDGRLLVADIATGAVRVLADGKTDIVFRIPDLTVVRPVWLSDGSAVVASAVSSSIETDLFIAQADGSGARALPTTGSSAHDPEWSPDGRSIAFTNLGAKPTLMIGDDRLESLRVIAERGTEPTWSPDGARIAYSGAGGIFVVGVDGRGRRRVTRGADWSPAWSPDGTTLAFARSKGSGGSLYLVKLGAGPARGVFAPGGVGQNHEAGEVVSISWSPNGSRLAFRVTAFVPEKYYGSDEDEVLVIDTRGKVVSRQSAGGSVTWSPDGRFLLHGSRRWFSTPLLPDGGFWVTRPGGGPARLPDLSRLEGFSPSWQPLCTRSGSERADTIRGGSGAELLCGLGGADVLTGGAGRDRIFGQAGNDRIHAGDGSFDVIGCGEGDDVVFADKLDLVGVDCERVTRRGERQP